MTTIVTREYAWRGTSWSYCQTNEFYGVDGSGTETAVPTAGKSYANCNWLNGLDGPVRVGIYATNNCTSRTRSGAGYYGVMELSGNIAESTMTVALAVTRAFLGTHGDGELDSSGDTDQGWPCGSYTYRNIRGGSFEGRDSIWERIIFYGGQDRGEWYGIRGVRTAP